MEAIRLRTDQRRREYVSGGESTRAAGGVSPAVAKGAQPVMPRVVRTGPICSGRPWVGPVK